MNRIGTKSTCGRSAIAVCLTATVIMLQFWAHGALAQDWSLVPQIGVGAEYDDNAQLSTRTDEEVELNGFLGDARLELGYISPGTRFFFEPRLRILRYSDNPDFDSDDQFADMFYSYDTQANTFRLRGDYGRESIRTAERDDADLEVEDPDDNSDSDTGAVIKGRRERIRIRPLWEHRFNDYSRLITRLEYRDVSYHDELIIGGLNDYTDSRAWMTYERDISDRNTLMLQGTGRIYDTTGSESDSSSYGLSAGLSRSLSPSTRVEGLVGFESIDQAGVDADPTYTVNLSIVQRLEVITLVAQYRRSIAGSGLGELVARDSINFRFTRDLSERFAASLGVRAYRTEAIEGVSSELRERDYVQLRSLLTFNFTEQFWVEADYRYTFLRRTTLGESANSNNVNVWFRWRPQPRRRNTF